MYRNLIIEMTLRGVTIEGIAKHLGIHRNSVSNKVNGRSKFTIEEAFEIQNHFFHDVDIDTLFKKEKKAV